MTSIAFRSQDLDKIFRTAVGFDQMFDRLFQDSLPKDSGFPPYNIRKVNDEQYAIEMAVAGFTEDELDIELKEGILVVSSNVQKEEVEDDYTKYIHRGIAKRNFTRRFTLSDDVIVKGANLTNGLLVVDLQRIIPEERKPRKIQIGTKTQTIEHTESQLLNE